MLDLEPIKAREAATTEGPWIVGLSVDRECGNWPVFRLAELGDPNPDGCEVQADVDFIAHARSDIPALIAEVEEQREWIKAKCTIAGCWRGECQELEAQVERLRRQEGKR